MTDLTAAPPAQGYVLRRLYFIRFAFALVWAGVLIATAAAQGPLLTVLVVIYPLVDAAAVAWQLRSEGKGASPRIAEMLNIVLSLAAAIGLGILSTISVGAILAGWGVWAILSGITQLVTALLRRSAGGQIPLVISGAISVLAGGGFLASGLQGGSGAIGIGGYAVLGGIFFLIAAIRLSVVVRRNA
ncbi:hypothetical protein N1028_18665 [Herbiconiux sp. CPCC 203407]|uniref:DUF308 domain-containing protein n=1 Tax=Herbiconiux oxytropis TaxID=2970915 RepID=A0AA42BUU3_9MICO|nr:hypothetical protein [Herbiconiux oxytropis]MCS5723428.1 hypothetical protein [Herbiconiux oxytropis]MCS5727925.1 hypothetical protein [Herbiconiux oxytropis]